MKNMDKVQKLQQAKRRLHHAAIAGLTRRLLFTLVWLICYADSRIFLAIHQRFYNFCVANANKFWPAKRFTYFEEEFAEINFQPRSQTLPMMFAYNAARWV